MRQTLGGMFTLISFGFAMAFLVMVILANEIGTLRGRISNLSDSVDNQVVELRQDDQKIREEFEEMVNISTEDEVMEEILMQVQIDLPIPTPRMVITDHEAQLMAKVVEAEAGICDYDTKEAVAGVIVNRVLSDLFPDTVNDVIFEPGQFDVVDNGSMITITPSADALLAVESVLWLDPIDSATIFLVRTISGPKSLEWINHEIEIGRFKLVSNMDKDVEFYKVVN